MALFYRELRYIKETYKWPNFPLTISRRPLLVKWCAGCLPITNTRLSSSCVSGLYMCSLVIESFCLRMKSWRRLIFGTISKFLLKSFTQLYPTFCLKKLWNRVQSLTLFLCPLESSSFPTNILCSALPGARGHILRWHAGHADGYGMHKCTESFFSSSKICKGMYAMETQMQSA